MPTIGKTLWKRLVPALAAALLLAAPPALAEEVKPPAPTLTSVTAEDGEATLQWTYDSNPSSFQWRGKKNDGNWIAWGGGVVGSTIGGTARSHTIGNIKPGNTYTFQVRALVVEALKIYPFNSVTRYSDPSNSMSVDVPEE